MLKVLVVEDDESIRKTMGWVLESLGHQSHLAGTGEEAILLVDSASQYQVLLVDLSLPGMSGEQFAVRWLQALPKEGSIPDILFCSALQEGELRASAVKLQLSAPPGKVHFLRKPFRIEELERLLNGIEGRLASSAGRAA